MPHSRRAPLARQIAALRGKRTLAVTILLFTPSLRAQTTPQPNDLPSIRLLVQQGQFGQAETDLRRLLSADPNSPANALLGYVLFRQHDYIGSLAAYTAAARTTPPTSADLVTVASDYIQLKSYSDAARWLTYVTVHDSTNLTAWYLLGRTAYLQDHPAEALSSFQHCLLLDPYNLRAEYNSGLALEQLHRPEEAEQAYRTALRWQVQTSSQDPQPSLDLGTLLLNQNKPADALKYFTAAASQASANPLVWQQLGRAQQSIGDTEAAIASFRRATTLAPLALQAHFFLGRALRQSGDTGAAAAEFATVDRLQSTHTGTDTPNPDTPEIMSSPPKG